jgi:hypothetical protein
MTKKPPIIVLRENRVRFDSPEYAARIAKVMRDVESLKSKRVVLPGLKSSRYA